MTIFGWDSSHYDGVLTAAILRQANAEGIVFWTHKLGEGLATTDPYAAEAFGNANGLFQVIGGYYFIHHGQDMAAQAHRCVALADELAPYWRTFDGWFFQTDAETEQPYGLPTPAEVKTFSDTLAKLSGKTVIVYASAGMYGNRLAGLGHPLWNAHYGSNPHLPFEDAYPGDDSAGWNEYSGQIPVLLQYGSNTTIGGLTTCDANAFRGAIDDLLTLIGADMSLTQADATVVISSDNTGITNPTFRVDAPDHVPAPAKPNPQITLATAAWVAMTEANAAHVAAAAALAVANATAAKVDQILTLLENPPPVVTTSGVTAEELAAAERAAADVLDPPVTP